MTAHGGTEMAVSVSGSRTQALREQRDRYVAKGVSVQPIFAQSAHGTKLIDVDGKEYLDFAGGIGVLNLGHTPDAVVAAIKAQADALLHSCFPVAGYAPYIDVCQLLVENTPGNHAEEGASGELGCRGGRKRRQDRALHHESRRRDHV